MKHFLLAFLCIGILFAGAACEDDSDEVAVSSNTETTTTTAASDSVTFTGTLSEPAPPPALTAGLSQPFASVFDPTQYELFCVTFTDPPLSGTGAFDADGAFSVTVDGAAGRPGCRWGVSSWIPTRALPWRA